MDLSAKKQQQSWFFLLTAESKPLSPDHRCLEGFHQEARKLFQQRKTSGSASIRKFLISASDDKTLHGCWRRCLFMRSVIREDGLDVLFALRASVANVTSTNWTKKRRFSEKLTVLIIVISDAMIPVNSGTFFSFWLSHPQWVTPSARILFIVIVFLFSRLLPSVLVQRYIFYKTRVCRWKHVSPVWI